MATSPGLLHAGHASGLHAVSRELGEMRAALLRTGDETRMVRLSVLSLVVACADRATAERAAEVIERMVSRHPARAIVVVADRRAPDGIEADLRLSCSADHDGQVCAELVQLSVGGESALHLHSVVTPLLLPDVPVHLWLAGAPPLDQAFRPDTLELCERVILDSDAYPNPTATLVRLAAAVRDVRPTPALGDLAWSRIRPWRELAGRAFDTPELRGFVTGVEEVAIRCAGAAPSAQARYLGGWLTSRLDRPGYRVPDVQLLADGDVDGGVPAGAPTAVQLRASSRDRQARIDIVGHGAGLTTSVAVDAGTRRWSSSWILPADRPGHVQLVGDQLEQQGPDPVHIAALLAAAAAVERP